ncbi:hypothetical protein KCU92_g2994, partial [Aureobasidium melanogenum]
MTQHETSENMQQSYPDQFMQSCLDHVHYPLNLIPQVTKAYPWELEELYNSFADVRRRLCFEEEQFVNFPIRDVHFYAGQGTDVQERSIRTLAQLEKLLGHVSTCRKPIAAGQQNMTPSCRFVYVHAADSRSRLRVTYDMLTLVLTHYQVMPGYLDFLHAFGAQSDPKGQYFTGFYQHTTLGHNLQAPEMTDRSWRQYQMCYNLRGVTCSKGADGKVSGGSVRQAAINHQFDIVRGTAVWIVTKGRDDLLKRFDGLAKSLVAHSYDTPEHSFQTSLEVHLMFCRWSAEDWRRYIDWLEDGLESNTSLALYGSRDSKLSRQTYEPIDLQKIQMWKEKTTQAKTLLESNADVVAGLRGYYVELLDNEDFPFRLECRKSIQNFAADIESNIIRIKMQVHRLDLLSEIISDRKDLVAQHFQNQVAERTEQLNHNLEKEAIVMRIITIVTLVYLPATFVSTFFSTDVVHYQASGDFGSETSYSHLAMMRWLQVTLPLTFVTILGAWMAFKTATISRKGTEMKNNLIERKDNMKTTWGFSKDIELGKL